MPDTQNDADTFKRPDVCPNCGGDVVETPAGAVCDDCGDRVVLMDSRGGGGDDDA